MAFQAKQARLPPERMTFWAHAQNLKFEYDPFVEAPMRGQQSQPTTERPAQTSSKSKPEHVSSFRVQGGSAHAERRVHAQKPLFVFEQDPFERFDAPMRGQQSQLTTERPAKMSVKRKRDEAEDVSTFRAQGRRGSSAHRAHAQKPLFVLEENPFEPPAAHASRGSRSDAPADRSRQPRLGAQQKQVSGGEGRQSATHMPAKRRTGSGAPPPNPSVALDRRRLLMSYKWNAPNSCVFDNGIEIWFRSWLMWDQDTRKKFAEKVRRNSLVAIIFAHYEARRKWIYDLSIDTVDLTSIQHQMRVSLTEDYDVLAEATDFSCCRTWLSRIVMVRPQYSSLHL